MGKDIGKCFKCLNPSTRKAETYGDTCCNMANVDGATSCFLWGSSSWSTHSVDANISLMPGKSHSMTRGWTSQCKVGLLPQGPRRNMFPLPAESWASCTCLSRCPALLFGVFHCSSSPCVHEPFVDDVSPYLWSTPQHKRIEDPHAPFLDGFL